MYRRFDLSTSGMAQTWAVNQKSDGMPVVINLLDLTFNELNDTIFQCRASQSVILF